MGGDVNRCIVRQTNDPEKIFDFIYGEMYEMLQDGAPIKGIAIDSIKSICYPGDIKDKSTKVTMGGSGAKYLGSALKRILPPIREFGVTTALIQQVYEEIDPMLAMANPYKIPDGRALKHFCDYMLEVTKIENKKSKVICDFYDVTGMYAERESLKTIFNEEVVDQDFECEEFIFKNADGIISRHKKKVFLDYLQKYKRTKNILEFQQYPLNKNIIENKNKVKENTKVQMVYCGTLIPPDDPNHPKELFPPAGMKDAFEILLSKGYEVYIYLPINGNFEFNKWIFDLKKKKYPDSLFILESLPFDELIKEISSYDYGINLQNIDLKNSKVSNFNFSGGMGTKTFTYLEAGLPILVNSETKYSKEIIEQNKIGISLNSRELHKIDHILKNVDYSELKKNVKRFNKINNLYIKGNELVSFYESL